MSRIINTYSTVLNYDNNRSNIEAILKHYSQNGFKLVSTEVSNGDYLDTLYLFFVKEVDK